MHSKATPNSPFTAHFCFPHPSGKAMAKPSMAWFWNNAGTVAWKSLLLLLLLFSIGISDIQAQSYTTRVYANGLDSARVTGICAGCDVQGASLIVDAGANALNTYGVINAVVSVNASVSIDIKFPTGSLPTKGTTSIIKVGSGSALSLSLLGGITVQAFNGVTAAGPSTDISNAIANLLAVNNQTEVYVPSTSGTGTYDRVRITVQAPAVGLLQTLRVYSAYYNTPAVTPPPIACDTYVDVLTGVASTLGAPLGAVGSVTNPLNAVDGNLSTFAVLNATAAAAAYVQENVIFPGLSKAGDSVRITVSQSGSLLSVALLNALTFVTYNGQTIVDSIPANSNFLVLNLFSGGTGPQTYSFQSSGQFDHVQVRYGALLNALGSVNVHEIQRISPSPTPVNGTLKTTCLNTPITLRVSNPDNVNLNYTWYDSTQTTVLSTADSLVLQGAQVATAGTFRYYVSATRKACTTESAKALVTVVVANSSTAADITVPATTLACPSDTVRITPTSTVATNNPVFRWYKNADKTGPITNGQVDGSITYGIDSTGTLSITGLTVGSYTYYVSVSDSNHCENGAGALKSAAITVSTAPAPAVVVSDISATTGLPVTLTAQPVTGATIVWYSDTTMTAIGSGTTLQVGPFNNPGTYTYYAGVRLTGGCESYRVPVVITVTGPVTGVGCDMPTSQVTGTTLGCILCSVSDPTYDIDTISTNYTQLNIPVGLLGGSVYQQLIFPTAGLATDSIRLDLGSSVPVVNVSLLGGVIITVANGNTVIRRDTVSQIQALRLLSSTRYTVTIPATAAYDRVQVLLTGVANLLNSLQIYGVRAVNANPTINPNGFTTCVGSPATLSVTPAPSTTVQWFADSTSTTVLSSQNTYTTGNLLTPGTVKYYVQVIGSNNCPNPDRIPVLVTVNPLGTAADITLPDTTVACGSASAVVTPTATGVTTPVFKWYTDANKTTPITNGGTIGSATFAIDTTGKLTVTGLLPGNYTYYVSVSGANRCENAAGSLKAANIKVTVAPAPPTLVQSYTVTTGLPLTLVAAPASGATVVWYSDTTKASIGSGNSITLPPFSTPGTYQYFAGDSLPGGCLSYRLLVTVTVTGPVSGVGCNMPTSQVTGTTLGCILCSVSNPTYDIDTVNTNYTQLNIPLGLLGGSVYQQLIFPTTGLATDSIRFDLGSSAPIANIGLLGGAIITVANGNTVIRRDTLSQILTLRLLSSTRYTVTIPATAAYDRVQVLLTGVVNLLNTLQIYGVRAINANPTITPNGFTTCVGSPATLSVTPAPSTTVQWFADSTSTTVLSSQNTYTTGNLLTPGTVKYYVQVIGSNGCPNPDRIPVLVTVNPLGTAADITLPDTTVTCGSTSAVLTPTATGVTTPVFKWYTDANKTTPITNSGTIGSATFAIDTTGKLTVTGLLPGNYTYYVSVSGANRCENAAGSLKAANIKVTTAPAPPTLVQNYTVTTGLPLTLVAAPVSGATVVWYSDTTQASIGSGNSITLPPFSTPGTYQYFAGDSLPGGCLSYRLLVTVTVTGPVVTNSCNVPTSQVTGTTLGCILCSVSNPTYDIDTVNTNYTQLNIPLGLLGGSVYQQLIFPAVGAATDSIRLDLGTPSTLVDLSLLGGTVITVYNGATVVSTQTISQLLTLRLLNGTRFIATVAAGGAYDRVEVKLTGVANLLNALDIYGVRAVGPNPTITANSVTVCAGLPATLTATPSSGTSVQWFADSTGGVSLSNQATYTTDTLRTPGTYNYYVQVIDANNCANPERIPVTVTVNPLSTPATITLPDTTITCGSAAAVLTPTATGVNAPVFNWYADANKTMPIINGGTIGSATFTINASTGQLSVTGLTPGNYTYYVSVSGSNYCDNAAGNLKAATIKVTTTPAPPTLVQDYTVTTGLPLTLVAAPISGATVVWYSDTTQAPIATGDSIILPPFNMPGTYQYFAGDSLPGGCLSYRLLITVTVTGPVVPNSCNVPTSQVTGTTLGCILCSVSNPTYDIDTVNTNYTQLNIPLGLLGGSVYQQLIFPAVGAATDSIRLDLGTPSTLADLSLLGGTVITVYNGATVVNTQTISQLLTLRLLNGTRFIATVAAGGAYDRVEVKLTGVANLLNALDIYSVRAVAPNPTLSANNTTICAGQPAVLTATPSSGTTVRWYADSTTVAILSTQNTYTTDTLRIPGTFTYYVQAVDANDCANPDRIPVVVTVNPVGTPDNITLPDTTLACSSGQVVLTPVATGVTAPVFKWYKDINKTTAITNGLVEGPVTYAVDTTTGKLTITGLAVGNYTYYVSVAGSNLCENGAGALKAANVRVVAAPAPPVVTGDVIVQTGALATLKAAHVNGATIIWYGTANDSIGSGDSIQVGPFINPGTYTYYAAVRITGACESTREQVNVVVIGNPILNPQCNMPTSEIAGTTLGCILCSVIDPNDDIDSSSTDYTRLNIPLGILGGSVYQQLIFPNAGSANDSIRLTLGTPVGLADVSLLGGTLISLYNNNTLVKVDTLASLFTLRALGGQQFTATIAAPAAYDRVEVRLTGVLNLLNSLDIYGARIFYPNPVITTTNASVCINQPATLSVTPAAGTSVRWYADSTSTTVLSTQNTYTTDTLRTAGIVTYYVSVVGGANCANPDRIPVSVNVAPAPPVPGAPTTVNICPGADASLQVSNPDHNYTYRWYNVPTGGSPLNTDSGFVFTVPAVTHDTTFYVEVVSSCGAVSPRQAISVVVSSSLSAPTVTPNPANVPIGAQAVLTATSNTANAIFHWYGSQTGNDSLFTGATYTPPTSNTQTSVTYWVDASLTGGTTCTSIRVPVVVNYTNVPPGPVPCEGATSQTIGGGGLLILGDVYNPDLAVDNNTNTASSLVIDLGALNAEVWERAKFNGISSLGDTVRVLLSNPSQLLSASLLGSVQITAYNGNTPGDSVVVNNPLVKLTFLNNNSQALVEFVPTNLFDAVEVKLKSGILGALSEVDFNYAQRALVAPKVVASQVTVCAGNTATLQVQDPAAGVTYRWYNSQGVYLTGKDGVSFTTGILTMDTTFYVEASRNGCQSTARTEVDIIVITAPVAPAVQATNVEVCAGSDAVLAVANPLKGYSYTWYNVAVGGSPLNTDSGFTYTVTNVTGRMIYYVEAKSDSCNTVSTTRTADTVNVAAALMPPTVTPMVDSVAVNQQPVFQAQAATANAEFYWFSSQTSTDTLFKGATFAPPAPTTLGTTTYWVEAALPGGATCKSERVAVKVVAVNLPPDMVPCEGATSETISGSGLLISGNVYNPELAVDNNINTAASLVINLGVLNASVAEKVIFNGISTPGDTVRVMLSNPSQILSATLLGSVQLTTYNGNTPGDSLLVSNPLLHIDLLSGGNRAILSFVPTQPFDGVEVKLKSGIVSALTQIDFNYAQRVIVQPTVQVNNAQVCKGSQAVLSVINPAPGITYSWFNSQGNHLIDSVAYVTPTTLDSGVYKYYVVASRNNCNSAASALVTVTVLNVPPVPVPTGNDTTTICANTSVTLSVNAVSGVQYNWYDAATGGTKLVTNSNQYTTPANLTAGTYTFYVEAVNGNNCTNDSGRTKLVLIVNTGSTASDIIISDTTICQGSVLVLTPRSTTVQNPVFKWYTNPDKTGQITAGVSPSGVLTVSDLPAGTYTYYVSVSDAGRCENTAGNLKAVRVTVTDHATASDIIVRDTTICAGNKVTLTASTTTVTNPVFKWYQDAGLTTLLATGPSYTTPVLTVNTSYYVTVEGDNKCANSSADAKVVTVTVLGVPPLPVPTGGDTTTTCVNTSVTLSVNAVPGVQYNWYDAATGGTKLVTNSNQYATPVNLTVGTYTFYVEAVNGNNCTNDSGRTKLVLIVNTGSTASDIIISDTTICQGSVLVLTPRSTTVQNPVFKWYTNPDKTGQITAGVSPSGVLTVSDLSAGTYTYYVSVSNEGRCENSAGNLKAVRVTVTDHATASDIIVRDTTICAGSMVTLTASTTTVTNPVFKWYQDAGLTTLLATGPSYTTPVLTVNTSYYVTVEGDNKCANSPADAKVVTVTVLGVPPLPVPTGGDTTTTCVNTSVTLSVNAVPGVQYNWYDAATGGTKLVTNSNQYTTPANLTAGTYTFYVEAVNGNNCTNDSGRTKLVLIVNTGSTASDIIISDTTICQGSALVLTPRSTTVQNPVFKWYTNPDKTGQITAGVSPSGVLTVYDLPAGTYTYYVSVSNAGRCENTAGNLKAVRVTVTDHATASDIIVRDTTICAGSMVTLTASTTTVTNPVFKWYQDASLTTLLATGPSYTTPVITTNTSYYVTVEGDNKCANSPADAKVVTVSVSSVPVPIVAGDPISICVGDATTLTVQNAEPGVTYHWYNVATGGTSLFTGPVYHVTGLTASTDFYVEASLGGCVSTTRAKISIGVGEAPVPIVEATDVTICQGTKAVLKVISSVNDITYKWYTMATGGAAIFTGPIFTTDVINANTTFYVEAIGDTSKCGKPSARAMVNVNVVPVPAAPELVSNNVTVCQGQDASLAIKNPVAGATYQWFDAAGNQVNEGPVFNIIAPDATVTYYVQVVINGGCSSASKTGGTVTVNSVPATPVVAASALSVCPGGSVTLSITGPLPGVTYRWYDAPTGGNLLGTGISFITGPLSSNTDFYAEGSNGNCASAVRAKISIGVGQMPTPTVESDNVTVCMGSTATFRITSATNGITYTWYDAATGGNVVGSGPVFTTGALNTTMNFWVEATGDVSQCGNTSNRLKVTATVVVAPNAPDVVASSLRTCAGSGVTVAVNTIIPGVIYQWYDAPTGGSLLATGAVYNVPVITQNTTYYVQANMGSCSSSTRTAVTVNVDQAPPIPTVDANNMETCVGGTVTFSVTSPDPTLAYRWYNAPSNGLLLATGTSFTTGALAQTTSYYLVALNNSGCSSAAISVTATIVNNIAQPQVDPITICSGTAGVLTVKNKTAGVIYNWYTVPSSGSIVFTGSDFTINPTASTIYYVESSTSGGCVSSSRTQVVVTVNTAPAAPAVANATLQTCPGQTVTLNALNPDVTLTYNWYTTAIGGGTPVATGASYQTPPINANQMYYLEAVNSTGCASATRTAVSVITTTAPAQPTVTGNDNVCPGKTDVLMATSTTPDVDFRWYITATGGAPVQTGATFVTPPLSATTTYYVEAFTSNGCVNVGNRTAVVINLAQPLPTPNVTVDNTTATTITFRWDPVTGAQRYEVSVDNGETFIPPSSGPNGTTHTVTNLQPNQAVTIQVRAIGASDCETSATGSVAGRTENPQGNNIYVPNLFSPNGDGVNDIEYVYGTAIAQLEFRIYNQWGQVVFSSKDQHTGWDGTMNGRRQPVGVYVYILKATMQDGTVITKKGNITLMR
ncbi:gliding motility-associated C-terminal domain-containing protein [Chitinophaga sp. 30R24]|uniref:Ig-like domain-containing protein n=1 Tax=Chitinophaga sp. 30R24 TaxID=3248838 RepID=UPI003B8F6D85